MSGPGRSLRWDVAPVIGAPTVVRFDGRTTVLWWGQDEHEHDCVAARTGRLLTWDSEANCRQTAQDAGWTFEHAPRGGAPSDGPLDLDPAREWVSRRRLWLDPVAGLDLWNWAWDVSYSTGQPFNDRARSQQRCYDKLVAANIPHLFDVDSYHPTWTPHQLRALRAVLGAAIHIVRTGLGR